jgi:myxalamid-type polyketide synthase MxaE and MxaD
MNGSPERIAIVGIGCRFPGGATDPSSFWRLLMSGVDAITDIPPERATLAAWYDPRPATPGRMMSRRGGFLPQIDRFDAAFFEMSPREAERVDPQQRLLLEAAWEAFEDAGADVRALAGSRTGVFVGEWASDYEAAALTRPAELDFFGVQGSGRYTASGRLSFAFGLRGPALTVDTAAPTFGKALTVKLQGPVEPFLKGE